MRNLAWALLLCAAWGCRHSHPSEVISEEEGARVLEGQRTVRREQEAKDQPLADCLPHPVTLDMQLNGAITVRDRLHALGAHAVGDHTLVDRNGGVIYVRPEQDNSEPAMQEVGKFFKAITGTRSHEAGPGASEGEAAP